MPQTFSDNKGRTWEITLDAPKIEQIRRMLDFDPVDLTKNPLDRLEADPVLLVQCLDLLRGDQHANVSGEDFGESLVGDVIEHAYTAFVEALADFFPQRKRLLLLSQARQNAAIRDAVYQRALAKIEDPDTRQKVQAAMESQLDMEIQRELIRLNSAMSSPESAESVLQE